MSKTLTAPQKFSTGGDGEKEKFVNNPWTGSVIISDRLFLSQVELIEDALEPVLDGKHKSVFLTELDKPKIPALLACVEKWELKNFPDAPTPETFPLTPRRASHELIGWLFKELTDIYIGETDIPNA